MKRIFGYENEIQELLLIKNMLLNASNVKDFNLTVPKGLVLYGEPGVGKTQMARVIAGDGVGLVEIREEYSTCDDLIEVIKQSFLKAKANQPMVILLSELDKMIDKYDACNMDDNSYLCETIIKEIDNLADDDSVFVVATCSCYQILGDKLLCPSRLNRYMFIDSPDLKTRCAILKGYFELLKISNTLDYEHLARLTAGYTGERIKNLVNDVGIYAFMNEISPITTDDVRIVMNRSIYGGLESAIYVDENILKTIAIHEAGHAVVALALLPDYIFGVSILPQGNASGHVNYVSSSTRMCSLKEVEDEIVMILGGHVAERICGEYIKGASEDLRRARQLVEKLAVEEGAYGYEGILYNTSAFEFNAGNAIKDEVSRLIVNKLNQFDKIAESIIVQNKSLFEEIVKRLLEQKILLHTDLSDLLKQFSPTK